MSPEQKLHRYIAQDLWNLFSRNLEKHNSEQRLYE